MDKKKEISKLVDLILFEFSKLENKHKRKNKFDTDLFKKLQNLLQKLKDE